MTRTKIARFRTPLLNERGWAYVSTQTRVILRRRWHDVFSVGLVRLHHCHIFARWFYKNTNARNDTTMQSTESPILFRSCGHETPFSDQKGASKIGDSVLCYDALLFSDGCVCIGVKYLQDGFTPIQTHAMTLRCVAFFGLVRLYLCNIFARWFYTNTNARDAMTLRCAVLFSDWCVCIFFVKYLQDGFTKIQTHAMTRRCFYRMGAFVSL